MGKVVKKISPKTIIFIVVGILLLILVVILCFRYKENFIPILTSSSSSGTITQIGSNWQFTPTTGYYGPVQLTYVLTDSSGGTSGPDSLTFYISHVLQMPTASVPNVISTSGPATTTAAGLPLTYVFSGKSLLNMLSLNGGETNQNINYIAISSMTQQYVPSGSQTLGPQTLGPITAGTFTYQSSSQTTPSAVSIAGSNLNNLNLNNAVGIYPITNIYNTVKSGATLSNGNYTLTNNINGIISITYSQYSILSTSSAAQTVWSDTNSTTTINGPFTLVLTPTGSLQKVDSNGSVIWTTNTNNKGTAPYYALLQSNGTFAIYDFNDVNIWTSGHNSITWLNNDDPANSSGTTNYGSGTTNNTIGPISAPSSVSMVTSANSISSQSDTIFTYNVPSAYSNPISVQVVFYVFDSNNYGQTIQPGSSNTFPALGPFSLSFTVPWVYQSPVAVPVILSGPPYYYENTSFTITPQQLVGSSQPGPGTFGTLAPINLNIATCVPGQYINTSTGKCVTCPAGSYCTGNGASIACPSGLDCPAGSSTAIACQAGYSCSNGIQTACSAGSYSGPNATTCIPCAGGSYSGPSAATCTNCPAGSYCPAGSSSPQSCPAGSYCPVGSTSSITCPAGSYCPAGSGSPTTCPNGYYCPSGSSSPTKCNPGTYCNSTGIIAPVTCPAGYSCPDGSNITQCPAGTYCPQGSSSPTTCPAGYYCPAGTSTGTSGPYPCSTNDINGVTFTANTGSCTAGVQLSNVSITGFNSNGSTSGFAVCGSKVCIGGLSSNGSPVTCNTAPGTGLSYSYMCKAADVSQSVPSGQDAGQFCPSNKPCIGSVNGSGSGAGWAGGGCTVSLGGFGPPSGIYSIACAE